jgi:isopenicillin-N N-acyltransferase-like protein
MAHDPPIIEASGTHREVGRQIGEAARDLIEQGLATYEERFPLLAGFSFEEAVERARPYLLPARDYVPQAVEQLRGLAEGANASFDRLFALNCSEEFTCAADHVWPRGGTQGAAPHGAVAPFTGRVRPAPEHCTSFAVMAGGRVVSGHNEDWYPEDVEGLVIRKVRLTGVVASGGDCAYLSVGAAYNLPMTGITSHGFTSAANTVYYRDERVGVPNNCLLTAVLEQPDLERARGLIKGSPRARGSNHLLADADGRIWDLETSGEQYAFIDGGDLFAHTNHYVSSELSPGDATGSEGSPKRRERATELLAAGVQAGTDLVQLGRAVLSDHANAPFSICSHWDDSDPDEDQSVTTASMVWEPAEGRAHIACGQPCQSVYVTHELP